MHYLICVLIAGFCLFAAPAQADDAGAVQALLKEKIDAVVLLLQDRALDKSQRNDRILAQVAPLFDYPTMAQLSLGKKYWPTLSAAEQQTFSDLFIRRLQQSYLEKLDLYTDEQVLYETAQVKGSKVHVPTTLISQDNRVGMLYKFYRAAAGWKIYDVEIAGVSVIQTYRSQFDGVLQQGTVADLLDKLRTQGTFAIPAPGEETARPGA